MNPAPKIDTIARIAAGTMILLALGTGLYAWRVHVSGRDAAPGGISPPEQTPHGRTPAETIPAEAWSVFQPAHRGPRDPDGRHPRFRLAGTFFLMGSAVEEEAREGQRLAILDDVPANRQHIVSERQSFEGYDIVRIYQDRVILRYEGEEFELTLSFKDGVRADRGGASREEVPEDEEAALETNRFGKRIGETRWVIQKQSLVDYYQELLDQPERIAAIYLSMKPDYNADREIKGYRLEMEGEADFFNAIGLKESDTIRRVNSMNMVSQARAEYFISEFMQDRLGAVVIDLERDGEDVKLIYLLR